MRELLIDKMPSCFAGKAAKGEARQRRCFRKTLQERAFERGRRKLREETNLISIVRQLRAMRTTFSLIINRDKLLAIKKRARVADFNISSTSDEGKEPTLRLSD